MSTNETRLHAMRLTYMIDNHQWLRTMPATEAPIDAGGAWVRSGSGDMEDGITFGCFLVALFSSSLLWISAQYNFAASIVNNN
jgi:hypothetical protein